jgi:hypothetical protein
MRTTLLDLVYYGFQIGVTSAKASREPVSAALGYAYAIRDYCELSGLTRRNNNVDAQPLLDEGHETRDLDLVGVLSCWAVHDFDFHFVPHSFCAPSRVL